jgi:hypothetical protein
MAGSRRRCLLVAALVINEFESATNVHRPSAWLGGMAMLFPNGGLIFMGLVASMIRIYGVIRMPNACPKP